MRIKPLYRLSIAALLLVAACQSAPSGPDAARAAARKFIDEAGRASAQILNVIAGDRNYRQADELYCIETDASSPDGAIPYLVASWRRGGEWQSAELTEGFYEWDLYGCPRP